MRRLIHRLPFLLFPFAVLSCSSVDMVESPADYVNPFIGASTSTSAAGVYHGLGKTFPGAVVPFGMVQVSPNTITGGDNGSGYSYEHKTIEGFAMTQMSGVGWNGELGNFLVMPTSGPLMTIAGKEDGSISGYRSEYDKESETASAGYYSVMLSRYGVKAESTATERCGVLRFTFPENPVSRIQVDLARRVGGTADEEYVKVVDDRTIQGWIKCSPDGGGWGDGEGNVRYTVYFYATFSRPIEDYGFWSADIPDGWSRKLEDVTSQPYLERVAEAEVIRGMRQIQGKHIGFFTEFPTAAGDEVEMKVGISFVDLEGARKNYLQEVEGKTFDEVRGEAVAKWNEALGKVRVSGGTDTDKTVFYTALYHTMIDPRVYTDVDGRYVGGDLEVHQGDSAFTKRTVFSGWDVFRSQFPLQTIINPSVVNDVICSLVSMAEQSGREYFERWELLNSYSGCMLGNPALPVLADAYVKGIRSYDVQKAYRYARNTSDVTGNGTLGFAPEPLSISKTLEYAYGDWCISVLAGELGYEQDAEKYREKSLDYVNVFDPEKGWFRPRCADGSWMEWNGDARLEEWYGCIECNPYQQGWFVPHDIEGMVSLMGGKEAVLEDLESMFENTPEDMLWNEYYNHANEPVHFVPFLFNRLGEPWLTQKWTRFVCSHAYSDGVEGLVGNEDVGQMSAWYVLAASGIHPSCPGDSMMEITSPVFDRIDFTLDPVYHTGKTFSIIAHDNSPENVYIQKALLNGEEYDLCQLDYDDIVAGGTLELFMGDKENHAWGIE